MLSILADALMVATRLDSPVAYPRRPAAAPRADLDLSVAPLSKRTWAQIAGLRA